MLVDTRTLIIRAQSEDSSLRIGWGNTVIRERGKLRRVRESTGRGQAPVSLDRKIKGVGGDLTSTPSQVSLG